MKEFYLPVILFPAEFRVYSIYIGKDPSIKRLYYQNFVTKNFFVSSYTNKNLFADEFILGIYSFKNYNVYSMGRV